MSAQLVGFIFLHTFQLDGVKFGMVMKQFKQNILKFVSVRFIRSQEVTAVLLTE